MFSFCCRLVKIVDFIFSLRVKMGDIWCEKDEHGPSDQGRKPARAGQSLTRWVMVLLKVSSSYQQHHVNSYKRRTTSSLHMSNNNDPFSSILDIFNPSKISSSNSSSSSSEQVVTSFINSLNKRTQPTDLLQYFDDDITYPSIYVYVY